MSQDEGAVLSECEQYRYALSREWDGGTPPLTFLMLNPSTADATTDDPTIGRCIGFAKDCGYGALRVLNLFAFRATNPEDMMAAPDPVGPDNDKYIREAFVSAAKAGGPVIAAWGANGVHAGRDATVRALATECGVTLMCLGTTKDGHPRHPLYVPAAQEIVTFS